MSYARLAPLKLTLCCAVLALALPSACATGVQSELEDTGGTGQPADTAGSSTGGTPTSAGSGTGLPHAGTTATGGSGVSNPFGGTSSAGAASGGTSSAGTASGGSATGGSATGGAGGAGGAGGSATGGKGGTGGSATGGSATGGSATGGCACPTKKTWVDNTSINIVTGDCFDVGGAVYLYTGTTSQNWANKDCNPAMQLSWCTGSGYQFMLCK